MKTSPTQADIVYHQLRTRVLNGTLPQGYNLNERAIATLFGASRTPVREGVGRLVDDGLAEREGRGHRVTVWDDEKKGHLYEMRAILESEACRLAAMRRSENTVIRLQDALANQLNLKETSPILRRNLNYEFHHIIWEASGNPFLVNANTKYGVQSMCITPTTLRSHERWKTSLEEHENLVEHIIAHRSKDAKASMRDHLEAAFRQS